MLFPTMPLEFIVPAKYVTSPFLSMTPVTAYPSSVLHFLKHYYVLDTWQARWLGLQSAGIICLSQHVELVFVVVVILSGESGYFILISIYIL